MSGILKNLRHEEGEGENIYLTVITCRGMKKSKRRRKKKGGLGSNLLFCPEPQDHGENHNRVPKKVKFPLEMSVSQDSTYNELHNRSIFSLSLPPLWGLDDPVIDGGGSSS